MENKTQLAALAVILVTLVIGESVITHNSNNELQTQINDLNLRLEALESVNNSQSHENDFSSINYRLDSLESYREQLDEELTLLNSLESRVNTLETDSPTSSSNVDLDDLQSRIEALEFDVFLLGRDIDILSQGGTVEVVISDNRTRTEYATIDHTHSEYSLDGHTHIEYSLVNHTHYYSEIRDLELFVGTSIQMAFEPDFTSEWVTLHKGNNLIEHNLGTSDLIVYVLGKDDSGYTHQMYYGTDWDTSYTPEHNSNEIGHVGIYWTAGDNTLTIVRGETDYSWDQAKVLIWKIPAPNRVPATR